MQITHNEEHGITPQSIIKDTRSMISVTKPVKEDNKLTHAEALKKAAIIEKQMRQAAMELEFEAAAALKDELFRLKEIIEKGTKPPLLMEFIKIKGARGAQSQKH